MCCAAVVKQLPNISPTIQFVGICNHLTPFTFCQHRCVCARTGGRSRSRVCRPAERSAACSCPRHTGEATPSRCGFRPTQLDHCRLLPSFPALQKCKMRTWAPITRLGCTKQRWDKVKRGSAGAAKLPWTALPSGCPAATCHQQAAANKHPLLERPLAGAAAPLPAALGSALCINLASCSFSLQRPNNPPLRRPCPPSPAPPSSASASSVLRDTRQGCETQRAKPL